MMLLLHPREATLLRYAAGSAKETARRQVASHLADCDRCRGTVQSTRELRTMLASGGAVGAPDPLLQRILQSRVQGERVILPVEAPVMQPAFSAPRLNSPSGASNDKFMRPAFWLVLGGVAAVALVQVGANAFENAIVQSRSGIQEAPANHTPPTPAEVQARLLKQQSIPAAGPINPSRLRPVTLKYGSVVYDRGARMETFPGESYKIVRSGAQRSEWILISQRGDYRKPDSVWIDGTTLEATAWHSEFSNSGVNVRRNFTMKDGVVHFQRSYMPKKGGAVLSDSLLRKLDRWYRPIDSTYTPRHLGPPARGVQNNVHFIALMMTMPLTEGWRGRFAELSSPDGYYNSFLQNNTVEITGSHTVITPAGVFDCWEASQSD
ncbi:MAG: hypothetical protein ABIS00_11900, partial [Gemmatimonadales bacterium]